MIPPRNFPPGTLKLIEYNNKEVVRIVAEMPSNTGNLTKIQQMRNDMLMFDPSMNLQIRENNS